MKIFNRLKHLGDKLVVYFEKSIEKKKVYCLLGICKEYIKHIRSLKLYVEEWSSPENNTIRHLYI